MSVELSKERPEGENECKCEHVRINQLFFSQSLLLCKHSDTHMTNPLHCRPQTNKTLFDLL